MAEAPTLELLTRRAPLAPKTADDAARTVEAVLSTGASVERRWDRPDGGPGSWIERLDIAGADLSRLDGAPLLAVHDRFRLEAVLGVVENPRRARGALVARLRFSERAEVAPIWADVRSGIIRQLRVGYRVAEWRREPDQKGRIPIFTAARWEPLEVSLEHIQADRNLFPIPTAINM